MESTTKESTTCSATLPPPLLHQETVDGVVYKYLSGFDNQLESEVLPGALPQGRNTPRVVPYNLYTEQLSGTAFTAPRTTNRRTWLYRIQPSVATNANVVRHHPKEGGEGLSCKNERMHVTFGDCKLQDCEPTVDPLRWKPLDDREDSKRSDDSAGLPPRSDFIRSMKLVCGAGDPSTKHGLAIYQYANMTNMDGDCHFCNADGDFLLVPCRGTLTVATELGRLTVAPTEIGVIPRGIVFNIACGGEACSGYVLEVFSSSGFRLPELGPIGSNGLANARDFLYPVANCLLKQSDYEQDCSIVTKMHGELFSRRLDHSPYNVLAWHGNYLPYKYDLKKFCAINSVSYDHLDPSIYTVLTCPSDTPGTALADFVIFPPRVLATDANTLRPPWFHRNTMSEYMGLIYGSYDAKKANDFRVGGASLHNCMTPHGPDADAYDRAVADPCEAPVKFEGGLAFMFETCLSLKVSPTALQDDTWRDMEYEQCWQELTAHKFDGWTLLQEMAEQG